MTLWDPINDEWRWPNFNANEMRCTHCGELKLDMDAMDKLQAARSRYGKPVKIHSAYRCPLHPIELAKAKPGPHTSGAAFDAKPLVSSADAFKAWFLALAHQGLYRVGFAPAIFTTGEGQFHVDWDMSRGPGAWYY